MNVFVEENSLKDIGNAIREKSGETKQYLPREMGDAVRGLTGGDVYIKSGMINGAQAFANTSINGKLTVDIKTFGDWVKELNYTEMFISCNIPEIAVICNNPDKQANVAGMFNVCSKTKIIDISKFNVKMINAGRMFDNCYALQKIVGELDFSNVKKSDIYSFSACFNLAEIRIKKNTVLKNIKFQYSPLLSNESIQSIIDGLATVTEPQTVSFHPDVKAKLTQEQITQITSKNWNLA